MAKKYAVVASSEKIQKPQRKVEVPALSFEKRIYPGRGKKGTKQKSKEAVDEILTAEMEYILRNYPNYVFAELKGPNIMDDMSHQYFIIIVKQADLKTVTNGNKERSGIEDVTRATTGTSK